MIDLLLPAIIFFAIVQKHLDRKYFISWIEENLKIKIVWPVYYFIQIFEFIFFIYLIFTRQSLEKLYVTMTYIIFSIFLQFFIKKKFSKNCPCFGSASDEGLVAPVAIYAVLLCISIIDFLNFHSLEYIYLSNVISIFFIATMLLLVFNKGSISRKNLDESYNISSNAPYEISGGDLSSLQNATDDETIILFISKDCVLCKIATTVIIKLQSLWRYKVYCVIKGYDLPAGSGGVSLEGLELISCDGADCFERFNIVGTPTLVYIKDQKNFVYEGLTGAINGFIEICFRQKNL